MEITLLSDTELVHRCLSKQDQNAFCILVNRYRNDIYRIVYHFLKNSDDSFDAMQEIFIKAYSSLPQLLDKAKFKPWLVKIAVNQALDSYRQRNAEPIVAELNDGTEHETDYSVCSWKNNPRKISEIKEINQRISEAVLNLSKRQQMAFILRYFNEMQISEIAETLSCSEGTVKANLHHALNHLRKELVKSAEKKGDREYVRVLSDKAMVPRIPVWGIIAEQIAEIQ